MRKIFYVSKNPRSWVLAPALREGIIPWLWLYISYRREDQS